MTFTFNGWQRLWVLMSSLYLIIMCAYVVLQFPSPEKYSHNSELLKKLLEESRALLVPADKEGWTDVENVGTDVEMPNGAILPFKQGVSETKMSVAVKEYWAVVTSATNERRLSLAWNSILWWFIPCIAIYIFGWAIGWVYRGFRV